MIAFRLPFPPSVNEMYGNNKSGSGRGRYKTTIYKNWIMAAGLMMQNQQRQVQTFPFNDRVCVEIQISDKCLTDAADSDNRIKPVLDLLKTQGIIKNDSRRYVRGAGIEWVSDLGTVECVVIIYPEKEMGL